jgi:hypothetical protein
MNSAVNRDRIGVIANSIAGCAAIYPLFVIAIVRIHYAVTSTGFTPWAVALLELLVFPVLICCALSLYLALRARGEKRIWGLALSILGGVLNLLFVVAASISD